MDKLLEELIQAYELHLKAGERNLKELVLMKKKGTKEYEFQLNYNKFWNLVLNDFRKIAEKWKHEYKKIRR